jgi:hypothetical protein
VDYQIPEEGSVWTGDGTAQGFGEREICKTKDGESIKEPIAEDHVHLFVSVTHRLSAGGGLVVKRAQGYADRVFLFLKKRSPGDRSTVHPISRVPCGE